LASAQPRDFARRDARLFRTGCRMHTVRRQRDVRATAKGVRWHAYLGHAHTRLPLSSATWAHFCISRNRPRAVANRRQWAGGPPTADLSNYTRRAGRRRPAPPGPMRCRGAQGICPLPGPAQRPAGLAAQWQLSGSRPSALRAARNQRRAAVAGRGPRASPSHRTGDGRLRARPRQTDLAGVLPIHRLHCQARQLRWRVSVA
jgi:hypothetical protein